MRAPIWIALAVVNCIVWAVTDSLVNVIALWGCLALSAIARIEDRLDER